MKEEEEEEKHETTVDNEDLEQKDISLIHENLVEVPLNEEEIIPGEGETTDKRPQSISASRQTLELARQLSKDIQETMSPGSEESTSLATKLNEQTVDVDENILSAWIPHPWVQSVLSSGKKVPPEHLTRPGLLTLTGQCDPIGDVLAATFPNVERKNQMTAESVKTDEEGLYTLITNGCYHAALNLTSMFLSAHGQGNGQIGQMTIHTYKTLQMWWARFSLLCHLDRYNEAYQEMEAFKELDQPDLYYQYNRHNYPGQIGSLVPYSMRILHAQLPFHAGNAQQSMNRLCLLQHSTENVLKHIKSKRSLPHSGAELTAETQAIAENIWTKRLARVKCILGSCLFRLKDYSLACQVYEDVIDLLPDLKPQLLSCIGRFCLTYGDCGTAEKHFEQVELLSNQEKSLLPLVYINNALIDIYKNQYSKAQQNFEAAAKIDVTPTKV
jgi:tetratricopeptide (TPR) repeat protein